MKIEREARMKVFSIIGNKKLREHVARKIIRELENNGYTVGYIKKADQISSNSMTKKAVVWGERQSLYYHEGQQSLLDVLKLFDEDYVIVDNDEDSNVPKLLMYEAVALAGNTVSDITRMEESKKRDDLFFTGYKDTRMSDIMTAVKEKVFEVLPDFAPEVCDECGLSCREMNEAILKGVAKRSDCRIDKDPVELSVGQDKMTMVPFVKNILKNSVEAVARELDGYKEDEEINVKIRKNQV